ncbi:MAG: nucleotidyltransferase domain-containing protein [Clostridia bacterium]|nr:nucleotidyltransferase domain-containing protein [Clostridia bacterium]
MTLREARKRAGITQTQAAQLLRVSLRSYKTYETDSRKVGLPKYEFMLRRLEENSFVDETHGILTLDEIRRVCREILSAYPVSFCYLFGSYARGQAGESSDVDLLISGDVEGLRFYGLVEALKNALKKNVDVLTPSQLQNNPELLENVLRDGIRLYDGRRTES